MKMKKSGVKMTKEKRAIEKEERDKRFNRAKLWQLLLFPASGLAQGTFMSLMMLVSFYAAGIVGLGTVVASLVITGSRAFDAITDPIVGFFIDRTKGKFGKVRPFLLAGYLTMSFSTLLMFFTTHLVPDGIKLGYFILLYAIYIFGYTFTGVATLSAQAVITNDPQQRPILGGFQTTYTTIFFAFYGMYVSLYLVPKHGGFNNASLFQEFVITIVILAGILTALGFIAIWSKDRIENFGTGDSQKTSFKDMWHVIKGNRPLQLFVLSAAADKLALQTQTNAVIPVMLFGIIIGDYAISGQMQLPALFVNLLMIFFGINYARKVGTKKGFVAATWGCIITFTAIFLLLWLGDPSQIGFNNWGFMTIAFTCLYLLGGAFIYLSSGLAYPMIPDIVDYETYRTGRFVPGIISTTYSFIDKGISSLSQTIVGLVLATIGFKTVLPDINTPYSDKIFWATMFLYIGTVMLGWLTSIVAMKFYPLSKDKMVEIQDELNVRRQNKENSSTKFDDSNTFTM
ncbi:MFS transporter [Metabacillus niabensis]|uniref:MFS transporter n=1 Tax=Metabacillus niabensis TaxID=324854 RepID=UPI0039A2CD51